MLSVPTSIYNCPVCKQGELVITEINDIEFEPNENHLNTVKVNITGIAKCNNCKATYKLVGKDTTLR